jgi:hypothetical protein
MQKDERDLLEVLKSEREFLARGGYSQSPKSSWRPHYIFEDSRSCANFGADGKPVACADCVLTRLVPSEYRAEKIPCRHIPLTESGETLDSLYRDSTETEIEETVGAWLKRTIERLEKERAAPRQIDCKPPSGRPSLRGTPLYQRQHPKCANPACHTAFHWAGGGKFFRFRPDPALADVTHAVDDAPKGNHGVRHYWLCQKCSEVFTLTYEENEGVMLNNLWPELPTVEADKESARGDGMAKSPQDFVKSSK